VPQQGDVRGPPKEQQELGGGLGAAESGELQEPFRRQQGDSRLSAAVSGALLAGLGVTGRCPAHLQPRLQGVRRVSCCRPPIGGRQQAWCQRRVEGGGHGANLSAEEESLELELALLDLLCVLQLLRPHRRAQRSSFRLLQSAHACQQAGGRTLQDAAVDGEAGQRQALLPHVRLNLGRGVRVLHLLPSARNAAASLWQLLLQEGLDPVLGHVPLARQRLQQAAGRRRVGLGAGAQRPAESVGRRARHGRGARRGHRQQRHAGGAGPVGEVEGDPQGGGVQRVEREEHGEHRLLHLQWLRPSLVPAEHGELWVCAPRRGQSAQPLRPIFGLLVVAHVVAPLQSIAPPV